MSTSAPLLCSGKTTDNKKRRKKKRKEKPKNRENKKSGLWFINYQNLIHQKKGKNSLVLVY